MTVFSTATIKERSPGSSVSKLARQQMSVPEPSTASDPVGRTRPVRRQRDVGAIAPHRKTLQDDVAEMVGRVPDHHLLLADPPSGEAPHRPDPVRSGRPGRTRSLRSRKDHSFQRSASPIRGQTRSTGADVGAHVEAHLFDRCSPLAGVPRPTGAPRPAGARGSGRSVIPRCASSARRAPAGKGHHQVGHLVRGGVDLPGDVAPSPRGSR